MIFMMLPLVRTRRSRGKHAGWMKCGERRAVNVPAVSEGREGEGGRVDGREGGLGEERESWGKEGRRVGKERGRKGRKVARERGRKGR